MNLGQKVNAIHQFGQKVMHGARVMGRKMSNTVTRAQGLAENVLPAVKQVGDYLGIPQVGAVTNTISSGIGLASKGVAKYKSILNS